MGFIEGFLFFGTKKYFFGVKIERKNVEKYRELYFWDTKKYFYLFTKIFWNVQLIIRSVAALPMTGNSSTQHQKGTGYVRI